MRNRWTDERLDDLNGRVSEGFERIDHELRDIRADVRGFRSDMREEFAAVRAEMGANQRILLQLSVGTIATMVVGFLGIIATQL